ncbi:MAG: CotH kinase family protein [Patescibacteria group bacterium]|nr:CotH kinase family protein [Patescibacteria group bacterium]
MDFVAFLRKIYYRIIKQPKKVAVVFVLIILAFSYYRSIDHLAFYRKYHEEIQYVHKLSNGFYVPYLFMSSNLPRYDILISQKNLDFLNQNLPVGYENNLLTEPYRIAKKAEFKGDGQDYQVKVRYRGDTDAHWRDGKKSWLVQFPSSDYFDDARKIHFIIPSDRKYLIEEMDMYRARKLGLLTPETKFVNLFVNGKRQGVYWQVEEPGKNMLEKKFLPGDVNFYSSLDFNHVIGPTGSYFDNVNMWEKKSTDLTSSADNYADLDLLFSIINNPSQEYFDAHIDQIIDMDNFLSWQVVNYLMTSAHESGRNMRFYFNPTLGKFQFTPWDVGIEDAPPPLMEKDYNLLVTRVLMNPKFLEQRNKILWDYVGNESNLADDLNHYDELDNLTKLDFYQDFNKVESNLAYRKDVKSYRQEITDRFGYLKSNLENADANARIYFSNDNLAARFEVSTDGFSSVVLDSIELPVDNCDEVGAIAAYSDVNGNYNLDASDKLLGNFICENKLDKISGLNFTVHSVKVKTVDGFLKSGYNSGSFLIKLSDHADVRLFNDSKMKLNFKNEITGVPIKSYYLRTIIDNLNLNLNAKIKPISGFIKENILFSLVNDDLVIKKGSYVLDHDIIVPQNSKLIIEPGTTLYMAAGATLFSYSPVQAQGTKLLPITIKGLNGSIWGSLAVIDAHATSTFDYVYLDGGRDDYINATFVSGMLSVYHSPALITNSQFTNAHGDDSINLKYAYSIVKKSKFIKNYADGIDLDVSNSLIEGNQLFDNGNDGVDVSSGQPLIINNLIKGSGDKCVSLGEHTQAIVFNNILNGCNYGFAAKDSSTPLIANNTIVNNNIGIAGYQKKQIFGGSKSTLINNIIWDNKALSELDAKSSVSLTFSDIQNGGWEGEGNISVEPKFDANYRLEAASPLRQAGTKNGLEALLPADLNIIPIGIIDNIFDSNQIH